MASSPGDLRPTAPDSQGRCVSCRAGRRTSGFGCNLHCAHCFVSSGDNGKHLRRADIAERVLPRLSRARVERITLTGGEPFAHPELMGICDDITRTGLPLGICTNATLVTDDQITRLARSGLVHVNVSFDGFRSESHRGCSASTCPAATTATTAAVLLGFSARLAAGRD